MVVSIEFHPLNCHLLVTMIAPTTSNDRKASFARFNATATDADTLVEAIGRDGGVIVESLITRDAAEQIKQDLKPHFDKDIPDTYGLFPPTTQRATGLLGISDACVDLACNPIYISVANALVSSSYSFWRGDHKVTVSGKPIISSTAGFRVTPGSKQQVLHRDDKYVCRVYARLVADRVAVTIIHMTLNCL